MRVRERVRVLMNALVNKPTNVKVQVNGRLCIWNHSFILIYMPNNECYFLSITKMDEILTRVNVLFNKNDEQSSVKFQNMHDQLITMQIHTHIHKSKHQATAHTRAHITNAEN